MADMDMVRRFAGADPDADPAVLQFCYDSAVEWYAGAGVPADTTGSLYAFWVANLAAWMYDNRGDADAAANVPSYIVASIHQLRPKRRRGAAGA